MTIIELLQNLGIFGLIIAGISWFAKSITNQYFSKGLESYKMQLQNTSQREMENLKSMLALIAYEHQVRFSRLYEKRANIIEETHTNLVDLHKTATRFVALFLSDEKLTLENRDKLWQAVNKFSSDFDRHRIYLEQAVCQRITSLSQKLSEACSALASFVDAKFMEKYPKAVLDQWEKATAILENDIPPIRDALTQSFQDLLGVDDLTRKKQNLPASVSA